MNRQILGGLLIWSESGDPRRWNVATKPVVEPESGVRNLLVYVTGDTNPYHMKFDRLGTSFGFVSVAFLVAMFVAGGLPLVPVAGAFPPTSSGTKSMTFYFHYSSSPPAVAGVSSNYIANTLANFQNAKNRDIKAVGQPKIQLDFYVYPPFAGTVKLSGDWQAVVFANSTALHPAGWNLEFWEKASNGVAVWDSGIITPTVLGGPSGNNGKIDSPIFGYTLTASNLTHSFASGNVFEVEITINVGSTLPLSVWYDSPHEPSRLVLPSDNYMLLSGISTLNANGTLASSFSTSWRVNQRNITIDSLITDPFGGYDVNQVLVSIRNPAGHYLVANQTMQRTSGTSQSFNAGYSYSFHYANNTALGNYTAVVLALDNNAQNQYANNQSYYPYAELASAMFSIGQLTQANSSPAFWATPDFLVGVLVAILAVVLGYIFVRRRKLNHPVAPKGSNVAHP